MQVTCPRCNNEFEADVWSTGECSCGNNYCFDEYYSIEHDESFMDVCWESYEPIKIRENSND